jgi:transposase-like protein
MIVVGLATERSTGVDFKGSHFERQIVLWGVRWYVAYPISHRKLEEMMEERGVEVDHSSLNRWMLKYTPLLDQAFRGFCCKFSQSTSGTEEVGLAYSTRE